MWLLSLAITAFVPMPLPLPAALPDRSCRRANVPTAIEDGAVVIAAGLLVGAAGALQFSLSSGEKGINAFLMKEKRDNPFYSSNFVSDKPTGPRWLRSLKLPNLDFVEVYGQQSSRGPQDLGGGRGKQMNVDDDRSELADLYRELDRAVEAEDYDEAARVKARIDETLQLPPVS